MSDRCYKINKTEYNTYIIEISYPKYEYCDGH